LVAGLVGQSSRWLAAERGIEYELADWATARQLVARGFTCGSHTMTHPHLASLTEAECRRELVESRSQLQDRLGQRVRHLAYPFGSCNARVAAIAIQTGYETACTVEIGRSRNESLFGLRRIPITGFDSLVNFIWRLETGWRLDEWWRGKLGRTARRTQPVTIGVPK
jgi:peptidoglycan/xylan/chitin deacetylase (PgdA/CDA1 family)